MEEEKIFKQLQEKGYVKYSTDGKDIIRFSPKGESFKLKQNIFKQIKKQMDEIPHIQCILNSQSEQFNSVQGKVYSHQRLLEIMMENQTYDDMIKPIKDAEISYLSYLPTVRKEEVKGKTVLVIQTKHLDRRDYKYESHNLETFLNQYEGISVHNGPYSNIGYVYVTIPHADRNERKVLCKQTLQMEEDIENIFKNL